jgi:hypothetical protein
MKTEITTSGSPYLQNSSNSAAAQLDTDEGPKKNINVSAIIVLASTFTYRGSLFSIYITG